MEDFDDVSWFPNKVTEYVKKRVDDPVMEALTILSVEQRKNVMRKMERAIHEEIAAMSADDRKTFEHDWTETCDQLFYHLEIYIQEHDRIYKNHIYIGPVRVKRLQVKRRCYCNGLKNGKLNISIAASFQIVCSNRTR